jgi:selenocysteine-specific elongation factor
MPGEKPERVLHTSARQQLADEVVGIVTHYLERNPHLLYVPFSDVRAEFLKRSDAATFKAVLDDLVARNVLFRKEAQIGLTGHEVRMKPRDQELVEKVSKIYRDARFASPLEEDVRKSLDLSPAQFKAIIDSLFQQGFLVRLADKVTYHRETVDAARGLILDYLRRRESITIAELRDLLKLSRKYAQAILEHFDETGFTKRIEDRHVLRKDAKG